MSNLDYFMDNYKRFDFFQIYSIIKKLRTSYFFADKEKKNKFELLLIELIKTHNIFYFPNYTENTTITKLLAYVPKIPTVPCELKDILRSDDLDKFKDLIVFQKDILYLASIYNANKIIWYCIDKNVGLNYIDKLTGNSAFTFLCFHDNKCIISLFKKNIHLFFTKNRENKYPIEYGKDFSNIINDLFIEYLNITELSCNCFSIEIYNYKQESKFKEIKKDDIIEGNIIGEGTYKVVKNCTILGRYDFPGNTVLKQYKEITDEDIEEIMIVKYLSENTELVPYIYGYSVCNSSFMLIEEKMCISLHELKRILFKTKCITCIDSIKECLQIKLVKLINELNKYSVINTDLKSDNIMLDSDGNLRIVDFSLFTLNIYKDTELTFNSFLMPPENCVSYKLSSYFLGQLLANLYFEDENKKFKIQDEKIFVENSETLHNNEVNLIKSLIDDDHMKRKNIINIIDPINNSDKIFCFTKIKLSNITNIPQINSDYDYIEFNYNKLKYTKLNKSEFLIRESLYIPNEFYLNFNTLIRYVYCCTKTENKNIQNTIMNYFMKNMYVYHDNVDLILIDFIRNDYGLLDFVNVYPLLYYYIRKLQYKWCWNAKIRKFIILSIYYIISSIYYEINRKDIIINDITLYVYRNLNKLKYPIPESQFLHYTLEKLMSLIK